jgi:hypothetical protein
MLVRRFKKVILILLGMVFLTVQSVYGQKDNITFNNLQQPDARIYVSLLHQRTIGFADVQYAGVIIRNNTSDKLFVKLEYSVNLTCGQVITGRIGPLGEGLVIQANQQTIAEGFWDKDNTTFDAGNRRNSECIKSASARVQVGKDKNGKTEYSAISSISFRLLSIDNLTEKEKKESDKLLAAKLVREGETKTYSKDFDGAIAKYNEALKIDPDNEKAKQRIIEAENKKREWEEKEGLKVKKEKAKEALKKGDEKLAAGDFDGAEKEYLEAEKLDPENANIKSKKEQLAIEKKSQEAKEQQVKEESDKKAVKEVEDKKEKDKQEAAEKRAAEVEAAEEQRRVAEELERRRIEEERQRIERKNQYYEKKQQEYKANSDLAAESAAELLLLVIKLGALMYENLDSDILNSTFLDDNWRFTLHAGYSISSLPMIFNSSYEDYDGNTTSYTNKSIDKQSATLDLNGGVELWPMYGKSIGFGLHSHGGLGIGLGLQELTGFAQGGARAYLGFERMKFYADYTVGFRNLSRSAWIDPQEFGSGKLKYNYHRIFTGLRHTVPGDIDTKGINITLGPLFELQDYKTNNYFNPIIVRWNSGMKLEIDIENRLNIFVELFPNYYRGGEIEEAYEQLYKATGTYFRIGVLRNYDFFGDSPYAHSDAAIARMKKKKAYTGISFINPSFNWMVDKNKLVTTKMLKLGLSVGFEQDIRIFPDINVVTGAIMAINSGGDSYNGVEDASYRSHSLQIPIGLRMYVGEVFRPTKKWISGVLKNDFSLLKDDDGFTNSQMKTYTSVLSFGGGLDYMLGANTFARVGISYDHGVKSVFTGNSLDIRKRGVSIQAGFIF